MRGLLGASSGEKVYHGILTELNRIVEEDNLRPGDKLPSERELSERLKVGRSSVREALRALELLGLITTRRGEGTFIQNYRHNKLFDLLGYYLLRDRKSSKDLLEMRVILELDAVALACDRATEKHFLQMESTMIRAAEKIEQGILPIEEDFEFHHTIARASKNSVMHRIWTPLVEYSKTLRESSSQHGGSLDLLTGDHSRIMEAVRNKDKVEAVRLMREHLEKTIL
ncbi:MAG TPA: FadR/GntR family transcriptional regulator [Bacillota bacterium]|nr:FadR/GntR family transcriptional regulator [Bacillota bacterium]